MGHEELALHEAYRTTVVMEDGHAMPMPVIQAVLRRTAAAILADLPAQDIQPLATGL